MKKEKKYERTVFSAEIVGRALDKLTTSIPQEESRITPGTLHLESNRESWNYAAQDEFFADYRKPFDYVFCTWSTSNYSIELRVGYSKDTTVSVKAPARHEIEAVFAIFEDNLATSVLPQMGESKPEQRPVIFIGHGRSTAWRDLKDHLQDQHGYEVEAYETGARAGHTIRDVLEDMLTRSSFALLVMTAEDEMTDGNMNPRLNVVHEAGLFQGKLGFSRAIILLESGAQEFSNIHGVQQLRFSKDNLKEVFGDVLATLRREFHLST